MSHNMNALAAADGVPASLVDVQGRRYEINEQILWEASEVRLPVMIEADADSFHVSPSPHSLSVRPCRVCSLDRREPQTTTISSQPLTGPPA
jgi:hypothetical protein